MRKIISKLLLIVLVLELFSMPVSGVRASSLFTKDYSDELNDVYKPFRYGIFTGDINSNFEFSGENFNLEGDARSNNKFIANCKDFRILGALETMNGDSIKAQNIKITEKKKVKNIIKMPDLFDNIEKGLKDKADIYYNSAILGSEEVSLENSLIVHGDAIFNYSDFKSKGSILVENNIMMNFNDYTMNKESKTFVYSKNSNIIINGRNSELNGVLYAPNGSVVLNGDNITLNGRIVAKRVIINARNVNIKTSLDDLSLINQAPVVDAGEDSEVKIPNSLELKGLVTDDGLLNEKTDINWTKISGSGEVKFENSKTDYTNCSFSEPGDYVLELSANDGQYTSKDTINVKVTGKTIGEIDLNTNGNLKENRKVVFDFSDTKANEKYPILLDKTEFNIEPISEGLSSEDIKEDLEEYNPLIRKVLFKKAGQYKVKIKLYNEKDYSELEKIITIEEDKKPIANFSIEKNTFSRDEKGFASIKLKDLSYSEDNDTVKKRNWKVRYDSNNDGSFDDEKFEDISNNKDLEPVFMTNRVGKYELYLEVQEHFDDTISKFITDDDYKKGDSSWKESSEKVFEVINEAPSSQVEVGKAKNLDLVVTVDKANFDKINSVSSRIEGFRKRLSSLGINANISTISTSSITAQDSFAWKAYDHPNYVDAYGQKLENHITFDDKDIKMTGYTTVPFKDFLYIPDSSKNQKTFSFDMQRDRNNWHTMEGAGFLFNTTVDDVNNTIEGYAVLMTESYIKLVKINKVNLDSFRNGGYQLVQHAGKSLKEYRIQNSLDNHHMKIVVDTESISVLDGDKLIIDNYQLPDTNTGTGFGPITSHIGHSCSQVSYFTFNNIVMETVSGQSLSDALNKYEWTPGAERALINLSDVPIDELKDNQGIAKVSEIILSKDLDFFGLGNETNKEQYKSLINAYSNNGMYLDNSNIDLAMDNFENYILSKVLSKDYSVDQYVVKGEEVNYAGYFRDKDGDPIYESKWKYLHDNKVYENNEGLIEDNDQLIESPINVFKNTGAYAIKLRVRDNPVGNNNALDEYRLWSDESVTQRVIMVHRRPIVELDVAVSDKALDRENCYITMTENSYDMDHESEQDKGIIEKQYFWKNIKDEKWTEGRVPSILPANEDYLVLVKVKDKEGFYSEPKAKYFTTRDVIQSEPIEDIEKPKVEIKLSKTSANVGERINVETIATDNVGIERVEVYIDGKLASESLGITSFIANEGKVIPIKVVVADAAGNETTAEAECNVVDNRDNVSPVVIINSPKNNSTIYGDTQIIGTVSDNIKLSKYSLMYRLKDTEEYKTIAEGTEAKENEVLGTFKTEGLDEGIYEIKLLAEDNTGNKTWIIQYLSFKKSFFDVETDKEAPVINLNLNKSQALVGENIKGNLEVTDNEGVKSVELKIDGDLIKSEIGDFEITANEPKMVKIEAKATDINGNTSIVTRWCQFINKQDITAPVVDIISPVHGSEIREKTDLIITAIDENKLARYVVEYRKQGDEKFKVLFEGESSVEDKVLGQIDPEKFKSGVYEVRLTAVDEGGNSAYTQFAYNIVNKNDQGESGGTGGEDNGSKVTVSLVLSKGVANLDEDIDAYLYVSDKTKVSKINVYVNDEEVEYKDGIAKITSNEAKVAKVKAVVIFKDGSKVEVKAEGRFVDENDTTGPIADIDISEDKVISAPTKIIGTAKDDDGLDKYILEYRLKDTTDYTTIIESNNEVKNGVLGVFDPTLLRNGIYDVRLRVMDKGGNITSVTTTYNVEGEMKIGHVSLGFDDINTKISGLPLVVSRMYDNRNKEKGDFGVGWTLGLNDIKLYESNPLNTGYEQVQQGSMLSTQYIINETLKHEVIVRYADGTSDRFKVRLSKKAQAYVPIYETNIEFDCVTNDKVKLEIVGNNEIYLLGRLGKIQEALQPTFQEFKLTMENGNTIIINKSNGIKSIEDVNGNKITIDKNGYHHSDGKNVEFKRDKEGKIIEAIDTVGDAIKYEYDEDNNLVKVIDTMGREVTMKYDNNHNLLSLIGPNGVSAARNEYDENGRLIAVVDADGNRVEYEHDIEGRQEVIKDKLGNPTIYVYDERGNVISVTDALGNKVVNEYDEKGNRISSTDQLGKVTKYEYDSKNNLNSATNALGYKANVEYTEKGQLKKIESMGVTSLLVNYDDAGNIEKTEDAMGNETKYTYEGKGRLKSLSDGIGTYLSITYDEKGIPKSTTDGENNITNYTYDDAGNCISKTITRKGASGIETITESYQYNKDGKVTQTIDGEGNITKLEYDNLGNISSSTDAKNRKTTYEYNKVGNLIAVVYADDTRESFTYDANGNVKTAINRSAQNISYDYDKLGNLIKTTYANGATQRYSYDAKSRIKTITSANGGVTAYEYDDIDRNTAIIDANGKRTSFAYNELSQMTMMTDSNGNQFKFEYDYNGNKIKTILPDGTSLETKYDARSRIIEQKDANGYITYYSYNKNNKLTTVTDALNGTWEYGYNEVGELVTVKDANKNITKYEYDKFGRVIKAVSSLGYETSNVYDEVGSIKESIDYNGVKTSYEYDETNRLIKKTVKDEVINYTYNKAGLIESVTDKNGATKYSYNGFNQLIRKELPNGVVLSYEYDKIGRLSKTVTPYGDTEYAYDILDRVVRVVGRNGEATVYEYDDLGNRIEVKYFNGVTMKYEYDNCSRLIKEQTIDKDGNLLSEYVYTLGKSGERVKVQELDSVTEYEYDKLYRLTKETKIKGEKIKTFAYTYDSVGNRLTKIEDGKKTSYAYNNANQLISEASDSVITNYTYDKNGNLILKDNGNEKTDYVFNNSNKLIRATIQKGPDVTIESYEYDFEGNRTKKIEKENAVTQYIVDSNNYLSQVVAELDGEGNLKTYYTRGEELISLERIDDYKFYLYDGHGSVRALVDKEGKVTDTYSYDAFGNLIESSGNTENSYLYVGEQFDVNTGFYYLRARYMNPTTGTFISMDSYSGSVFDPVSLHKYLYANANPVMNTDPTGYFTLMETSVVQKINSILDSTMNNITFSGVMKFLANVGNGYDTFKTVVGQLQDGATLGEVLKTTIKGMFVGIALNYACALGTIPRVLITTYGISSEIDGIYEAIRSGDWDLAIARSFAAYGTLSSIGESCFTGETLVATEDGHKRIDEIKEGDYVWTENVETGEKELKKVTKVFEKETDTLVHLEVNYENESGESQFYIWSESLSQSVTTTENHPFYVEGKGWVAAADLKVGDRLRSKSGERKVIEAISIEKLEASIKVYNLEVEGNHNYYVSTDEVLVHNTCGGTKGAGNPDWINNKGYKPQPGERTFEGYVKNNVPIDKETKLYTNSSGFNTNPKNIDGQFKRFGVDGHGPQLPEVHVHQPTRNVAPNGIIYGGQGTKPLVDVTLPGRRDITQLYEYLNNGKYQP